MTLMLSFGAFGGFYFHKAYTTRLCLGWVAFTFIPLDIDPILEALQDTTTHETP